MHISTIYIIGNLLVNEDLMPFKIKGMLEKEFPDIDFKEFDPTENLPEQQDCLIMVDTVKDIKKPRLFEDIDQFMNSRAYSLHDFDLGWQLKLYKKIKIINRVLIIGVPEKEEIQKVFEYVKKIISNLISENE